MTILEILKQPDLEILQGGFFIKEIVREYRQITGKEPCYCDTQLPYYLRIVRDFHEKNIIFVP